MVKRITKAWNNFLFGEATSLVYGVIRISISVILLVYLAVLWPEAQKWFGQNGILDQEAARQLIDADTWSVLNWFPGDPWAIHTFFSLLALQTLLLLAGIFPRFNVFCIFFWVVSLHHRNPLIWEGGDVLLRICLFLMIFMPLGSSLVLLRKNQGGQTRVPAWSLRLLQIQLTLIYLSSVIQKLRGDDWISGYALYYVAKLEEFARYPLQILSSVETIELFQVLTWTALAVEILLIFGPWMPRLRRPVVMVGIAFHLVIELSMNLFVFQWLMILILSTHLFSPPRRNFGTETHPLSGS